MSDIRKLVIAVGTAIGAAVVAVSDAAANATIADTNDSKGFFNLNIFLSRSLKNYWSLR